MSCSLNSFKGLIQGIIRETRGLLEELLGGGLGFRFRQWLK